MNTVDNPLNKSNLYTNNDSCYDYNSFEDNSFCGEENNSCGEENSSCAEENSFCAEKNSYCGGNIVCDEESIPSVEGEIFIGKRIRHKNFKNIKVCTFCNRELEWRNNRIDGICCFDKSESHGFAKYHCKECIKYFCTQCIQLEYKFCGCEKRLEFFRGMGHQCDICRKNLSESLFLRCKDCDYDCCDVCDNKNPLNGSDYPYSCIGYIERDDCFKIRNGILISNNIVLTTREAISRKIKKFIVKDKDGIFRFSTIKKIYVSNENYGILVLNYNLGDICGYMEIDSQHKIKNNIKYNLCGYSCQNRDVKLFGMEINLEKNEKDVFFYFYTSREFLGSSIWYLKNGKAFLYCIYSDYKNEKGVGVLITKNISDQIQKWMNDTSTNNIEECLICKDVDIYLKCKTSCCGQIYHEQCLYVWGKLCPICRDTHPMKIESNL